MAVELYTCSPESSLRRQRTAWKPSRAKRRATFPPIPAPAPTTRTTFLPGALVSARALGIPQDRIAIAAAGYTPLKLSAGARTFLLESDLGGDDNIPCTNATSCDAHGKGERLDHLAGIAHPFPAGISLCCS